MGLGWKAGDAAWNDGVNSVEADVLKIGNDAGSDLGTKPWASARIVVDADGVNSLKFYGLKGLEY